MADAQTVPNALPRGSRVVLVVSQGASPAAPAGQSLVPGVVGKLQGDALTKLQAAGLRARVFDDASTSRPKGSIVGQAPRENASAPTESEVVLLVSNGPREGGQPTLVTLPDVIGASEADAVQKLQTGGLRPEVTYDYSPMVPAGLVMDQVPNAADLAAAPKKMGLWTWLGIAAAAVALLFAVAFLWQNSQTTMVMVPDVIGMSQTGATTTLEDLGFVVEAEEAEDPGDAPAGQVVAQDPEGGIEAAEGSTVTISVAGAPATVVVPDVVGLSEEEATAALEALGLRANPRTQEDASVDPGTVVEQTPAGGEEVAPGSRVDIIVAIEAAPEMVEVPNVAGKSQADAEKALKDVGLGVIVVNNPSETVPAGTVMTQLPKAGSLVAPGLEVAIIVSSGAPASDDTIVVPDVVGMTAAEAEAALRDVDLKVQLIEIADATETVGEVFAQAPLAGDNVGKGTTVVVLVAVEAAAIP